MGGRHGVGREHPSSLPLLSRTVRHVVSACQWCCVCGCVVCVKMEQWNLAILAVENDQY